MMDMNLRELLAKCKTTQVSYCSKMDAPCDRPSPEGTRTMCKRPSKPKWHPKVILFTILNDLLKRRSRRWRKILKRRRLTAESRTGKHAELPPESSTSPTQSREMRNGRPRHAVRAEEENER